MDVEFADDDLDQLETDPEKRNMSERTPAEAFPPGEYLRDELEARGWTQTEFAEILGRPLPAVNQIINGKRAITPVTAKELAAALGTSAMFWLNLEANYQLTQTEPAPHRIQIEARLRDKYPVRELLRRSWIEGSSNPEVLQGRVLDFYAVESLEEDPRFAHAARKGMEGSLDGDLSPEQLAWLFRVKRIAQAMQVSRYSESRLRDGLKQLRRLLHDPEEARHVPDVLEESGVRFLIVEPMPGSKIDGVCFWLTRQQPVVAMTLRYDRIDNFWFVLRHELEHVLRRDAALDSAMEEQADDLSDQEAAANEAAAEFLVPGEELEDFILRVKPIFSEQEALGFAQNLEIHPGIAVGRLQFQLKRYDLLRQYLVAIREFIVPYAMTDGYGRACAV